MAEYRCPHELFAAFKRADKAGKKVVWAKIIEWVRSVFVFFEVLIFG